MAIKAACYCRVSTKKDEQLDSLEKQKAFFERLFTDTQEYELYGIYADEGVSAKSMRNRKAFARLLEDARAGLFGAVFVKDVSRFARNVQDFYHALTVLENCGVRVHFVTNGMRTQEASRFSLGLMALLAEDESERLSVKVKFGKDVTARRGRVPNFVFGYEREDAYTLVPHAAEAGWVRRIFSLYAEEGLGAARIAELLNAHGVATKRGGLGNWTQSAVCKLLKNQLYIGRVLNKKSEVTDFRTGRRRQIDRQEWLECHRPEFALVEEEIFRRAQEMLRERAERTAGRMRQSGAHPLSNLLRCAVDGRSLRRVGRAGAVRWVCSVRSARGAAACPNAQAVDEAFMHQALLGLMLRTLAQDPNAHDKIRARAREIAAGGENTPAPLEALKERKRRYVELYVQGTLSMQELAEATAPIDRAIAGEQERQPPGEGEDIDGVAWQYLQGTRYEAVMDNVFLKRWVQGIVIEPDGRAVLETVWGERAEVAVCTHHT